MSRMSMDDLAALDRELGELARMLADEDRSLAVGLESLEEDEVALNALNAIWDRLTGEVDILGDVKLARAEEFHSNVLAWLLDPNGSHGLHGRFLDGFLQSCGATRLPESRMAQTVVEREYYLEEDRASGRVDVLVVNKEAGLACVVENKVGSDESGSQLAYYRRVAPSALECDRIWFVYLTPDGRRPRDPRERDAWTVATYRDVVRLVDLAVDSWASNESVRAFLRLYAITLRRNIVLELNDDFHASARRIYRKHQRVMDLICDNRDRYQIDYNGETYRMVRDAVGANDRLANVRSNPPYARFLPASWEEFDELRLSSWPYRMALFECYWDGNDYMVWLMLRDPEETELGNRLWNNLLARSGLLEDADGAGGDSDLEYVGPVLVPEPELEVWWDEEAVRSRLDERLAAFALGDLAVIEKALVDVMEEYRSEVGA